MEITKKEKANMSIQIFSSKGEFNNRKDKSINGVSQDFLDSLGIELSDIDLNACVGCWNCSYCTACYYCDNCSYCNFCQDCDTCFFCSRCVDCANVKNIDAW